MLAVPSIPYQMIQQGERILNLLTPSTKLWVTQEAQRIASAQDFGVLESARLNSAISVRFYVTARAAGPNLSESIVDTVRFVVLLEAFKIAEKNPKMPLAVQRAKAMQKNLMDTYMKMEKSRSQGHEQMIQNLRL